jgi:hypothetical protein
MNNFGFLPSNIPSSPSSSSSSNSTNNNIGGRRPSFEAHVEGLQQGPIRDILKDLRNFVLSLGNNVIEEARPHRLVYAKTLTFRTFLDIQPAIDHLVVEVRTARTRVGQQGTTENNNSNQQQHSQNSPLQVIIIKTKEEAELAKKEIAEAYSKIR